MSFYKTHVIKFVIAILTSALWNRIWILNQIWGIKIEMNIMDLIYIIHWGKKNCVKAKPNGCENETECTWSGDKYKLVIILVC